MEKVNSQLQMVSSNICTFNIDKDAQDIPIKMTNFHLLNGIYKSNLDDRCIAQIVGGGNIDNIEDFDNAYYVIVDITKEELSLINKENNPNLTIKSIEGPNQLGNCTIIIDKCGTEDSILMMNFVVYYPPKLYKLKGHDIVEAIAKGKIYNMDYDIIHIIKTTRYLVKNSNFVSSYSVLY